MDFTASPEFQIVLQLLSPDYMWSASERYGKGDAIKGSRLAYVETRKLIRLLVNNAREREKEEQQLDRLPKDLELAMLIRNLGWPIFANIPKLIPITNDWRKMANTFWPNGTPINGGFRVSVGDTKFSDVYEATIMATSRLLKQHNDSNRAVLDGRVWKRSDSLVMVHFELRNGLMSMVMDPAKRDQQWVHRKLRKGLKTAVKFSRTKMAPYSAKLLMEWAKAGFIGSPAGAMISGCPGAEEGYGALVPCNGIPMVICVNEPTDGKVFIGVTLDHRALDGNAAKGIYMFLQNEIKEILNEDINHRRS